MAALAARSTEAQQLAEASSAEGDVLVEDYVWHEILGAEDIDLVEVMVSTAVVNRVNGSLAKARIVAVEESVIRGQPQCLAFGLTDLLLEYEDLRQVREEQGEIAVLPGLAPHQLRPGYGS